MNKIYLFLIFVSIFLFSNAQAGEVYKWKDTEGKVRYSDTLPNSSVAYERIGKKKSAANVVESTNGLEKLPITSLRDRSAKDAPIALNATTGIKNTQLDKLKAEMANSNKKSTDNQSQQQDAAINQENCNAAKMNAATYKNGGRIKRVNEKGESVFLSDAEIAAAQNSSAQEIAKYCNAQ